MLLTRHVEFDAGHRVRDHGSKCRHPHGHRYKLEATVEGIVRHEAGHVEDGMVCDFGILGTILAQVAEMFDHAFLVADGDDALADFLFANDFAHVVIKEGPPTAEVLAELMARLIEGRLPDQVRLVELTLWETPKCRATYLP